jgi:hypothetical protein
LNNKVFLDFDRSNTTNLINKESIELFTEGVRQYTFSRKNLLLVCYDIKDNKLIKGKL